MTTFNERERASEHKFARDEEFRFKVHARRNRKLGLWAAGHLGLKGTDAEKYAEALAQADVGQFRDEIIVRKIAADFAAKGMSVSEDEIRRQTAQMLIAAKRQSAAG